MRRIASGLLGLFVVSAGCARQAASPKKASDPDLIQFRLVEDAAKPDTVPLKQRGKDEALHVQKEALLNGSAVQSVKVERGPDGRPTIVLRFAQEGGKRFAEITGANVGKRLGIIVAGELITAPVIRSAVSGHAVITGMFTEPEARDLAATIRSAISPR